MRVLVVLTIFSWTILYSQNGRTGQVESTNPGPPTLQIGLGGVNFQKGVFDYDLLSELIAQRQKEIKVRLVKNMFLNNSGMQSAVMYNFIDNLIETLLTETDQETQVKNIMEEIVNTTFTVAFLEYYICIKNASINDLLNKLLESVLIDEKKLSQYYKKSIAKKKFDYEDNDIQKSYTIEKRYNNVRKIGLPLNTDFVGQICIRSLKDFSGVCFFGIGFEGTSFNIYNKNDSLSSYTQNNSNEKEYLAEKLSINDMMLSVVLDISAHVLRNNKTIKAMGLYRNNYSYSIENLYSYYSITDPDVKQQISILKDTMSSTLDNLLQSVGYFYYLNSLIDFSYKKKDKALIISQKNVPFSKIELNVIADNILTRVSYIKDTANLLDVVTIVNFCERIKRLEIDTTKVNLLSEVLYDLNQNVMPASQLLGMKYRGLYIYEDLNKMKGMFVGALLRNVRTDISMESDFAFLRMLGALYQFDDIKTYSFFLNSLENIVDIFPNDETRSILNKLVNNTKRFISVGKDTSERDIISIDIEGFLTSIQKTPYNKWRWLEFNFTLGANYAFFPRDSFIVDSSRLQNFAYFGEKLGFKFKLYDWEYKRQFNKGDTYKYWGAYHKSIMRPQQPVVSNVHLLVFGSGILYNLIKSSNQQNFDRVIVGVGGGVTFFNNLDLNVSWGLPISVSPGENGKLLYNSFLNIGFDIQFIDYITALDKKRRENKRARLLVKAQNNQAK